MCLMCFKEYSYMGISSLTLWGLCRGHVNLSSLNVFINLQEDRVPLGVLWRGPGGVWYWAVSVFSAERKKHIPSGCRPPPGSSLVFNPWWYWGTGSQGPAGLRKRSRLRTSSFHCFSRCCCCWHHQSVTCCARWGGCDWVWSGKNERQHRPCSSAVKRKQQIGVAALMQALHRSVIGKKDINWREELFKYQSLRNLHLRSRALGDRKNEITDTSGQNYSPLQGGWAQPLEIGRGAQTSGGNSQ